MRHKILFIWALIIGLPAHGQTMLIDKDKNYIIKKRPLIELTDPLQAKLSNSTFDIVYYDGLGRPEQSVELRASTQGNDIISPIIYNPVGRDDSKIYLPYVADDNINGAYRDSTVIMQQSYYLQKYPDETFTYVENVYDASPLNRVVESYNVGTAFRRGSGKKSTIDYLANVTEEILYFKIIAGPSGTSLTSAGFYGANTLHKNVVTNEDGTVVTTYTDISGRTILQRVIGKDEQNLDLNHNTYYIYDDLDNLCYVLPPELSARIESCNVSDLSDNADEIEQFAYLYKYDGRNRCITKKSPGADWVNMIYDKGDRLVMTQDGNMRAAGQWIYYVYDNLGRLAEKNLVETALSLEEIRSRFDSVNSLYSGLTAAQLDVPFTDFSCTLVQKISQSRYGGYEYSTMSGVGALSASLPDSGPIGPIESIYMLTVYDVSANGTTVTLSGSETGVVYHLMGGSALDGIDYRYGNGQPLNFTNLADGVYQIKAVQSTYPTNTAMMNGTARVGSIPVVHFYNIDVHGSTITLSSSEQFATAQLIDANSLSIIEDKMAITLSGSEHFATTQFIDDNSHPIIEDIAVIASVASVVDFKEVPPGDYQIIVRDEMNHIQWTSYKFTIELKSALTFAFAAVDDIVTDDDLDLRTTGLLNYEKIAVLDGDQVTNNFVERMYYYDYKGRVIQTVEKNHLGGISRYSTKYDFVGNILKSAESHSHGETEVVLVTPDNYEPFIIGKYLCHGLGVDTDLVIVDPEERYFQNGRPKSQYKIEVEVKDNGSGMTKIRESYYYIPEDCLDIVQNTISASGPFSGLGIISDFPEAIWYQAYLGDVPHYEEMATWTDAKLTEFTYDHRGRLLSEETTLNGGKPAIVEYVYDELGRLKGKKYDQKNTSVTVNPDFIIHLYANHTIPSDEVNALFSEILSRDYGIDNWADYDYFKDGKINEAYRVNNMSLFTWPYYFPLFEENPINLRGVITEIESRLNIWEMGIGIYTEKRPNEKFPRDLTFELPIPGFTETYDYNIQGWLTEKKSNVFDMRLRYYDPEQSGTQPSYTGNITEWEWQHKDPNLDTLSNTYAFTYDKLNRLTDSQHYLGNTAASTNSFTERGITYDKNGNMLAMKRFMSNPSQPYEDMAFTSYKGNQLITMQNNGVSYNYEYDANGNMTKDNYNALKLEYNYLNLTGVVRDLAGNVQAKYSWLADGMKTGVRNTTGTSGYEYLGSLVYKYVGDELQLESAGFEGGRIMASEGSSGTIYTPNYYVTDHLGSTRVIYNGSPDIARSDFLPYGARWIDGQAPASRYQFTGYEDQDLLDNKYMDAGARFHNGRIFNTPDPLSELDRSITPYAYTRNNPINRIDPDGRLSMIWHGAAAGEMFSLYRDAYLSSLSVKQKEEEEEERRELTKAEKRQFRKTIREMKLRNDILMGKYGPVPDWYLMGVEPSDEEYYEIWSNALSNAVIGIIPFTIFKGITWLTRGAAVSRTTSTIRITTADDLIVATNVFNRTKHGYHGTISGIGSVDDVFNTITTGGKITNRTSQSVTITMPNGTTITKYVSSGGHGPTIQINHDGKLYKIRIK